MTTERKFQAAVNVIKNLPKVGPFQASTHAMLKFYAYFKQATEGPNELPRPAFWDVVKRAKWDAWAKLGDMSKETAMNNYVEEFKKIVDAMSNTSSVGNINKTDVDSFYATVPAEDLELLIGPVLQKVRSQPGSPLSSTPLGSREASPQRHPLNVTVNVDNNKDGLNGFKGELHTDDEEDDFLDTIEISDQKKEALIFGMNNSNKDNIEKSYANNIISQCDTSQYSNLEKARCNSQNNLTNLPNGQINNNNILVDPEVQQLILNLQQDIQNVTKNINQLERRLEQIASLLGRESRTKLATNLYSFRMFPTMFVLLIWPIFIHLCFVWLVKKRTSK